MSAAIAPNPNDPQAPLGMPARPWWIGYIRQLHLDIPLAVESGGTGKNTPLDASDIAETDALKIMTAEERSKLAGIAENANNYTHPATHPQSMIEGLADALAAKAPLANPALTGTPTAPTAAVGTNTTQLATTAFVSGSLAGKQDASNALTTNTDQVITGVKTYDNIAPLRFNRAAGGYYAFQFFFENALQWRWYQTGQNVAVQHRDIAGNYTDVMSFSYINKRVQFNAAPTVPTATSSDNSTLAASTAFVQAQKASPALTGTPTAPTAEVGTNTTQLATTAFVQAKAAGALLTEGTPSGPTATGTKGMARFDADYFYVCTATNTWVRFPKDGSWT